VTEASFVDKKEQEKKGRLLDALDRGMVMVHLDARRPGVVVPQDLRTEAHLRLNLSYHFDPPDLSVNEWGVRASLSFSGKRFLVAVPWCSMFAITSYVTKEFWMYPDDMPPELIQQALLTAKHLPTAPEDKPKALLREVVLSKSPESDAGKEEETPKPAARGHLRVVK
jgi:stringent starvation protein B